MEFATSPEIVDLDSRIQDAGLQIAHIGPDPKTPRMPNSKAARSAACGGRKRRQELVDAIVGPETYAAIDKFKPELKAIDEKLDALSKASVRLYGHELLHASRNIPSGAATASRPFAARAAMSGARQLAAARAHSACVPGLTAQFTPGDPATKASVVLPWPTGSLIQSNMLTWRSIVNRVWQYHFGTGIVDTPSDFGRMGSKPTHPELLDWLAVWFRDDAQGSLKALHRMILTQRGVSAGIEAARGRGQGRCRQSLAVAYEPYAASTRKLSRFSAVGRGQARPDDGRTCGAVVLVQGRSLAYLRLLAIRSR